MSTSPFAALRRRIAAAGARPALAAWSDLEVRAAAAPPPAVEVVEAPFRHIDVGEATPWDGDLAFLDGTQHVELVGYVGTDPLVAAVVRAAVRIRHDKRMTIAVEDSRHVVIARSHVLDQLRGAFEAHEVIPLDDAAGRHPVHDLDLAHAAVDHARASLEASVAARFRRTSDCWMLADGTLAVSAQWASDPRMVGVVKTHGVLQLDGDLLDMWLTLPAGHRTSAYLTRTRHGVAMHAWGLRLWPWEGRDIFHGLVRVETAASPEALAFVDTLARHLLAERAPLTSAPRADRLLYGIHDVGRYLRASGSSR